MWLTLTCPDCEAERRVKVNRYREGNGSDAWELLDAEGGCEHMTESREDSMVERAFDGYDEWARGGTDI